MSMRVPLTTSEGVAVSIVSDIALSDLAGRFAPPRRVFLAG
jgi:hypothetical protein